MNVLRKMNVLNYAVVMSMLLLTSPVMAQWDSVLGTYSRHPIENDWHTGDITRDGAGLRWTNRAGASWTLTMDETDRILTTGPDNPYHSYGYHTFELIYRDGGLSGFRFSSEMYDLVQQHGSPASSGADSPSPVERADVSQFRETGQCDSCDLRNADLSGLKLNRANANDANLSGADLSGTELLYSAMNRSNLSNANLSGLNSNGLELFRANLSGANLRNARLPAANLTAADLTNADLTNAIFSFDGSMTRVLPGSSVDLLTGVEAVLCNTTMPDGSINNSSCQ